MKYNVLMLAMLAAGSVGSAQAAELGGIEFSGSGFMTIAAGRILGGSDHGEVNGYRTPAFVADYAQGGVYERDGWQMRPDSKIGLQGSAKFSPNFWVTGQTVIRGARDGKMNLEWVYGNYKVSDDVTLQFGRKRLPLFSFSESQDVGFAYPWVRLPPQLYGWNVVNYNGVNALINKNIGSWSANLNVFAGGETHNDSGYAKIYSGRDTRVDYKWNNIVGTELNLSRDWFEMRAVYLQSKTAERYDSGDWSDTGKQKIYGLGFGVDYNNWIAKSELLFINRKPSYGTDHGFLYLLGYRMGKFTPYISKTIYQGAYHTPSESEGHTTFSYVLRYDLTTSSALKVQYDRWQDHSGEDYYAATPYGSSRLLSVSYDTVF